MGLKVGEVKIEPYDINWKKMFEDEKKRLEKIEGLSLAFVSDYNIEIISKSSGKGNAVKNLLTMLHINPLFKLITDSS